MSKKSLGLAQDYIRNASNFIWAAEQLNVIAPQVTADGMFKAENPIYFLLCQASELILKSVLAKNEITLKDLQDEYRHDLKKLISKVREYQLPLDEDFLFGTETMSENYKKHEHRYARSFSGFSDEDHKKWLDGKLTPKELKEYGLIMNRGVNINHFIKGLKVQLDISADYLKKKEAA